METHALPTGYLFVDDYSRGKLETLSIGDYGKSKNVKAQFLGLNKDINGVANGPCQPLSEKWVMTLSTQYGCPMRCTFCDVPNIPFKGNASFSDLRHQFQSARWLFPRVKYTDRLNIHFARMGEPIFNDDVFDFAVYLAENKEFLQDRLDLRVEVIHPVLTTSLPSGYSKLKEKLHEWCRIKNTVFSGQAGLQLSINSTDDPQRGAMFGGKTMKFLDVVELSRTLPMPIGRKYCLNFAYSSDWQISAMMVGMFDPEKFMVKITPIHNNNSCRENGIETIGGYSSFAPYAKLEEDLINEGFDVLIFVPSMDEERGLVTCGNAILGGSELDVDESQRVEIEGL